MRQLYQCKMCLLQVYRGLDVITNKVGAEEKSQVPHHMMDYLSPCRPTTVTDFRDRALTIVSFGALMVILKHFIETLSL